MSTSTASPNATVALQALAALGARDFDALRALLSPDVRLEWPYHPSGEPVVIDGADAAHCGHARGGGVPEPRHPRRRCRRAAERGPHDHRGAVGGHVRERRPSYKNHYLFMLTLKDGKITEWREFYNPLEVLKVTARRARSA